MWFFETFSRKILVKLFSKMPSLYPNNIVIIRIESFSSSKHFAGDFVFGDRYAFIQKHPVRYIDQNLPKL